MSAPAFTVVAGRVLRGIALVDGVVRVGEPGRGRKLVSVAPPPGAAIDGSALVALPGEGVVVCLRDHSGYRGGWTLEVPSCPERRAQLMRDLAEVAALEAETEARIAAAGPEVLGTMFAINERHAVEARRKALTAAREARWPIARGAAAIAAVGGRIIAEGACAQGDAGYMGGGAEWLLRLPEGAVLEVARTGRLYGTPARVRLSVRGGEVIATDPKAEAEAAKAAAAW